MPSVAGVVLQHITWTIWTGKIHQWIWGKWSTAFTSKEVCNINHEPYPISSEVVLVSTVSKLFWNVIIWILRFLMIIFKTSQIWMNTNPQTDKHVRTYKSTHCSEDDSALALMPWKHCLFAISLLVTVRLLRKEPKCRSVSSCVNVCVCVMTLASS